jgi:hypothetical protein
VLAPALELNLGRIGIIRRPDDVGNLLRLLFGFVRGGLFSLPIAFLFAGFTVDGVTGDSGSKHVLDGRRMGWIW